MAPTTKQSLQLANLRVQGFDESFYIPRRRQFSVRCSQCEALVLNGVPVHERGCPNEPRNDRWDERAAYDLERGD